MKIGDKIFKFTLSNENPQNIKFRGFFFIQFVQSLKVY